MNFYLHNRGVFCDYRIIEYIYEPSDAIPYKRRLREIFTLGLQLAAVWFETMTFQYDGHHFKTFALFGLRFSWMYTYEDKRFEKWEQEGWEPEDKRDGVK